MAAMSKLTTDEEKTLRQILVAIDVFADLDKDMPLQQVRIMLLAALHEQDEGGAGASMRELAERAKLSLSAASAHVLGLGERNRYGEEGHKLIRQDLDSEDRRVRRVTLTHEGRGFVRKLLRCFGR